VPDAKTAITQNGTVVARSEFLWVNEQYGLVPCAPYDNHFIYESTAPGTSSFMCTCGSVAVVKTHEFKYLLVCLQHATYGVHATGENIWI